MRFSYLFIAIVISAVSFAKTQPKKSPSKKNEKAIKQKFLKICEKDNHVGISLARSRQICKCTLGHVLTQVTIDDVKIMIQKPPKQLKEAKTKAQKKKNDKLTLLSDLYVHTIDDCFAATAPPKK